MDRESAYEMLQKGFQASTEQQNNPPAKGKEVAVDDGILGGLKDILFGTTGPRGGERWCCANNGSAARGDESDCTRDVGSLLGEKKVSQVRFVFLPDAAGASYPLPTAIVDFHDFSGSYLTLLTIKELSLLYSFIRLRFLI